MQSGRKNGFFLGNKRIILGESGVVSRGLVRPCFDSTKVLLLTRPFVGISRHRLAVVAEKIQIDADLRFPEEIDNEPDLCLGELPGMDVVRGHPLQRLLQFPAAVDVTPQQFHRCGIRRRVRPVQPRQLLLLVSPDLKF